MSTKTNTATTITEPVAILQTSEDLKTALLIVSMAINLFVFTAWLVVEADPTLSFMLLQST